MSSNSHINDISTITTYESGIMEASAHRVLSRVVTDYLLKFGLTAMQWYLVGFVYAAGENGIRLSDLMRRTHTSMPYITNSIALLESKAIVQKVTHVGDSRIKLVSITDQYMPIVNEIESGLRDHLRQTLYRDDGIERQELQNYILVLNKIITNVGQ